VLSFFSPLTYLMHHRGATHSILLLPAWAWLLAWIAGRAFRNPGGWRPYYAIAAMSIGLHILGDLITSFGTIVFAPFSNARIEWGTTFIIDLWFTGIILAGLLVSAMWRRSALPAFAGCVLLVAYVLFQAWLKNEAITIGREFASRAGMAGAAVSALPRPVSPFNWTTVIADEAGYRYANINLRRDEPAPPADADAGLIARVRAEFQPPALAVWQSATRFGASAEERRLAEEAWNSEPFAFYRWFAEYPAFLGIDRGVDRGFGGGARSAVGAAVLAGGAPVVARPAAAVGAGGAGRAAPAGDVTCVWFRDLRFDTTGVQRDEPFRMGVCRDGDAPWRRYRRTAAGPVPFD
jgi:inner membrane protein